MRKQKSVLPLSLGKDIPPPGTFALIQAKVEENAARRIDNFGERFWGVEFDARGCAEILLAKEPHLKLVQQVLYSAFCAFLLSPKDTHLRRRCMIREIYIVLRKAENQLWANPEIGSLPLFLIQHTISPEVLFAINSAFGASGIGDRLFRSISRNDTIAQLKKLKKSTLIVTEILQICQFQLVHADKKKRNWKPSLHRADQLIRNDGRFSQSYDHQYVSSSYVQKHWSPRSRTASLIYAAGDVKISDEESLLDAMLAGDFHYGKHKKLLPEMFSRASFVVSEILANSEMKMVFQENAALLPDVEVVPISSPEFPEAYGAEVLAKFADRE